MLNIFKLLNCARNPALLSLQQREAEARFEEYTALFNPAYRFQASSTLHHTCTLWCSELSDTEEEEQQGGNASAVSVETRILKRQRKLIARAATRNGIELGERFHRS